MNNPTSERAVMNEPVNSTYDDNPRNPVKVAHLVFGCFFIGIAILWALTESDAISWQGTSYLVPLTLLLAGAIGLGASLLGSAADRRRRTASYDAAPVGTATDDASAADAERDTTDDTREL